MTEEDTIHRLQGRKNLYFLERKGSSTCFFGYKNAIVAAWSETEAKEIHPNGRLRFRSGDPEWYSTWSSPSNIESTKIGLAEIDSSEVVKVTYL